MKDLLRYRSGEVPMIGDVVKGPRGGVAYVQAIGGKEFGPAGDAHNNPLLYLGGGMYDRTGVPSLYRLIKRDGKVVPNAE